MIAIIDYGVGNLFSLYSSLTYIGTSATVTDDPAVIVSADKIILPGVGAFCDAAAKLAARGLDKVIKTEADNGKPILGICLGMQLLFDVSYEYGIHQGFGLIPGVIRPISGVIPRGYKIPKIGWNRLILTDAGRCDLIYSALKNDTDKAYVYFVHSFYADCPDEYVIARDIYGVPMTASVRRGNVAGVQFHPEKSGSLGLSLLRGFCFNESNMSNICPEDINI
ncbi:MAG: imidazole glycerol phosphate synthase subunit HisH [Eubacteriales bacterium]|jgi:glutamine amidotransferase